MPHLELEFEEFIEQLQLSALIRRDPIRRGQFAARFAKELAFTALYLHDLGVIGSLADHIDAPDDCDLCGKRLDAAGYFVDGMTSGPGGEWANMCANCYLTRGAGIGWGIGQLYRNLEGGRWQCIAGGDPDETAEDRDQW